MKKFNKWLETLAKWVIENRREFTDEVIGQTIGYELETNKKFRKYLEKEGKDVFIKYLKKYKKS